MLQDAEGRNRAKRLVLLFVYFTLKTNSPQGINPAGRGSEFRR
jgi:hypothetical protein